MTKILLGLFFACFFLESEAQCPAAERLINDYGISFAGFNKNIPQISLPNTGTDENLILIPLPNKKGHVHDGFFHSALISVDQRRAWIHRTGGFLNVNMWFGPVTLQESNLSGCSIEKYRKSS